MIRGRNLKVLLIDSAPDCSGVYSSLRKLPGVTPYMVDGVYDIVAEVSPLNQRWYEELVEKIWSIKGVKGIFKMSCEEALVSGEKRPYNLAHEPMPRNSEASSFIIVNPKFGYANDCDGVIKCLRELDDAGTGCGQEIYRTDYMEILAKLPLWSKKSIDQLRSRLGRMKCVHQVMCLMVRMP